MNLDDAYPREPKKQSEPSTVFTVFILVLCILILAAAVVPNVLGRPSGSSHGRPQAEIATLCGLIDQFRLDCGRYPTMKEGFGALRVRPSDAKGWRGPYLTQSVPLDPWGNPLHYISPSPSGKGYQVASYGADGQPGGIGENADIVDGSGS